MSDCGEDSKGKISGELNSAKIIISLLIVCVSFEIFLVIADAVINYGELSRYSQIRRIFNITREDGLATWFSVTQYFVISVICAVLYLMVRANPASKFSSAAFMILAIFFLYLSMDDHAEIHERLGSVFKIYAKGESRDHWARSLLNMFPSYPWQVVVGPIFAVMGLMMLVFLWIHFNNNTSRVLLFLGLGLYLAAIGLDFVEGIPGGHNSIQKLLNVDNYTVRHFSKSLEEFMEMLGTTFIMLSLLKHLFLSTQEVRLRVINSSSN